MSDRLCKLGVLISGRGSNMAAIQQAIERGTLTETEIAIVISDKVNAPGLALAESFDLPTALVRRRDAETGELISREDLDHKILNQLRSHEVDLVVLAGYGRILTDVLLSAYSGRIVNMHPSLLPAYGGVGMLGMKVHEAVLAAGEPESGCTVHGVTAEVDGGPVLGQARVPVLPGDTPETLAARILQEEHRLYPAVLQQWIHEQILGELRV